MISLIFLAGGVGSRMGLPTPKQFLLLQNKLIAHYSYELFLQMPEIDEVIVVCEKEYQHLFSSPFATPGPRRQDSVYSGLLKTTHDIVLTHDAARPFIELKYIPPLIEAVKRTGAAALATPVSSTVKECSSNKIVKKTLDRSNLWEMQTPQAVRRDLFLRAFDHVHKNNLDVTDELSMIEALGESGEIVPCSSRNFKITTPFDLIVAQTLCAIN